MEKTIWKTNWSKCCLCQQDKNEELKSPSENPSKRETDGYTNIATNIPLFQELNAMPIALDPARLNDGDGIEVTLRKNNAKYHQSCRLLFNNTKLSRAEKRAANSEQDTTKEEHSKKKRKSTDFKLSRCFLCEQQSDESKLRHAMTMKLNTRLNRCAKTLNDGRLLSILSAGDVVAQELKYHPACLTALYNRERAYLNAHDQHATSEEEEEEKNACAIAFSELVTYINETCNSKAGPHTFRLADLTALYQKRIDQMGYHLQVNSTRLKMQLLSHLPELEAFQKGRDVLLAFNSDIGTFLEEASKTCDAIHLAKSASILRKQMLSHKWTFEQMLDETSNAKESVPPSLLEFISMIEHGADIKSQISHGASKSDLAIAQLLQYNCFSKYKEDATTHRHSKSRESPFAVYVGLSVYSRTRKRQLVDMMYENGLSISYDRVLEITAILGEAVVRQYVEEGVVCSPLLRKGVFTTAATDNVDHNPTATTAQSSFHGTSISVFQHPSSENPGEERAPIRIVETKAKKVPELPESFTNIQPAHLPKDPEPSVTETFDLPDPESVMFHLKQEFEWLERVSAAKEVGDGGITWSAYHSSQERAQPFESSIVCLLPLLRDEAHSAATIKHVMSKVKDTVNFLNPGQIPVIAADQPLFALAKQIQWHWPEYGEDQYVVMFGGLHIEMAALRSLGTLLQGSGWTSAISEAEIASAGTANSFLSASSVTRTRYAHQVTASALYKLMKTSYSDYAIANSESGADILDFETWCTKRKSESPQFCYWYLVLSMELTTLTLIRSFREADFQLYCESLSELLPYFFANNNVNYARWLTIHLRDMMSLEDKHPAVAEEFKKGNFVIHKSERPFSGLAIDQAHEQSNAVVKGKQ